MAKIKQYAFTFSGGHHDPNYPSLGNFYTIIEAESESKARSKMYEKRGIRWSHYYEVKVFTPQIEEYGLKLVQFKDLKQQVGPTK